ncbi:MAG: hypothetical protein JKY32_07755 [Rhizobiales bacterium]|nr:hypothetical protein [Hyphomicrobiales bacterium]
MTTSNITYRYFADTGGWRLVVLFHAGRKWLKLLDTGNLDVYRLPARAMQTMAPYPTPTKKLATKLAARRASCKRNQVPFPKKAVQLSIERLRAA